MCSDFDPSGKKTVFESIPKKIGKICLVGRLDLNSEGLILLTNKGYIKRYFVQRANDNRAPISEVSAIKFSQIASNAFFKQIKLRWRITGPLEDYEDAEGNVKKGVYTSNKRSIEEQLGKMPSLKNRLVNLAEYHIDKSM